MVGSKADERSCSSNKKHGNMTPEALRVSKLNGIKEV